MASPQKYPNGASLDYEDLSLLIVEDSLDKEECLVVEDSMDKDNGEANAEDDPYEVNSHPSGDKKEAESESKKKHYFHLNESPDEDDVVPMVDKDDFDMNELPHTEWKHGIENEEIKKELHNILKIYIDHLV
ncbi:hypothetical protein RIF29_30634 [Crotalaria pallida]|uniref:Uncharacterized protein n=1 Tax=Crotalaria pallida TaxID=3830 RepID=A0AAN9EN99_CROPI